MTTWRTALATRLVRLIGIKRRLQELAHVDNDPQALARRVAKVRRTDRPTPPLRVRRTWSHEAIDVGGFPLHVLAPRAGRGDRVILYLHGGGYLFGPFGTEWAAMRKVAAATGSDWAMLIYPKAPEHHAAQTIDVAHQAFQLLADRYGARSVIVIGTSAGGGLALAVMRERRDRGEPLPSMAVLWSPGVDMTLEEDVAHLEAGDVLLSVDHVRSAGALYAGEWGARDPRVSPTFGDLSGLPPLHVFVGTAEIVYPSMLTFADRARVAGSEVHLIVGEGQQHTWPVAPTPEGREALERTIEIVR